MTWYAFDSFQFEVGARVLRKKGEHVPLPPKAGDLLLAFLESPQAVLPKEDLMKRVWPNTTVVDSALAFQINTIQKVLGERPDGERYIKNFPKRGYRFNA